MDKKKIILTTMLAVVAINSTVKAQQAGSIQLAERYNMGISNIAKNDYPDQRLKNNWFGISLLLVKP